MDTQEIKRDLPTMDDMAAAGMPLTNAIAMSNAMFGARQSPDFWWAIVEEWREFTSATPERVPSTLQ